MHKNVIPFESEYNDVNIMEFDDQEEQKSFEKPMKNSLEQEYQIALENLNTNALKSQKALKVAVIRSRLSR